MPLLMQLNVRMIEVKDKLSGFFRTFEGAELFAAIRSYISTACKQGRSIFRSSKQF
jgi:transposase